MLVMHYRIKLSGDRVEAAAAIRRRVAERGRRFDGMQGLARKFFLLDAADPTYATLYLWRDPDAALAFLQGSFFAAVIESFGRALPALAAATKVWRDLFAAPEDVYTKGLAFMKSKWGQFA